MGKAKKAVKKLTGGGSKKAKTVYSDDKESKQMELNTEKGQAEAEAMESNPAEDNATMLTGRDDGGVMLTGENKKKRVLLGE